MDTTAVREISNVDGSIYLSDLYSDNGEFYYQPCLVFEKAKFEDCWDNSEYVFNFLRKLKKHKKEQIKELKIFCKENNFDFETVLSDLIDIYETSKTLKFWKKNKK